MAPRSVWKGHIRFSLVTIPVKMFKATDDSKEVKLNELHLKDMGRVGRKSFCKDCGEELTPAEVVKGYPVSPGQFVVIEKEDIAGVKLESTKMIDIQGFVATDEIHPSLFESPSFIAPDGPAAYSTYALLRGALESSGRMGIGRFVARGMERVVAIASHNDGEVDGLMLYYLRAPDSMRSIADLPGVAEAEASEEEVALAESLVDSMTCDLASLDLSDRYRDAMREMVEAKVAGGDTVEAGGEGPVPAKSGSSALDALKASLAAVEGGAVAVEAEVAGEDEQFVGVGLAACVRTAHAQKVSPPPKRAKKAAKKAPAKKAAAKKTVKKHHTDPAKAA